MVHRTPHAASANSGAHTQSYTPGQRDHEATDDITACTVMIKNFPFQAYPRRTLHCILRCIASHASHIALYVAFRSSARCSACRSSRLHTALHVAMLCCCALGPVMRCLRSLAAMQLHAVPHVLGRVGLSLVCSMPRCVACRIACYTACCSTPLLCGVCCIAPRSLLSALHCTARPHWRENNHCDLKKIVAMTRRCNN